MRRRRPGFWYGLAILVVKPTLLLTTRRTWRGAEHVPETGGVIVVANHLAHVDPLTIAHFLYERGRLPRFVAKSELFRVRVLGHVMRGAKQIPVYRDTPDAAAALRDAVAALRAGECVLIYPEGTLTRDPEHWPMRARTGVARLALETGVPVVPIGHWGEHEILPPYTRRFHLFPPRHVTVVAGPAVDLSRWGGRRPDAAVLREVTDAIMADIRSLVEEIRGETAPDVWDRRTRTRIPLVHPGSGGATAYDDSAEPGEQAAAGGRAGA